MVVIKSELQVKQKSLNEKSFFKKIVDVLNIITEREGKTFVEQTFLEKVVSIVSIPLSLIYVLFSLIYVLFYLGVWAFTVWLFIIMFWGLAQAGGDYSSSGSGLPPGVERGGD